MMRILAPTRLRGLLVKSINHVDYINNSLESFPRYTQTRWLRKDSDPDRNDEKFMRGNIPKSTDLHPRSLVDRDNYIGEFEEVFDRDFADIKVEDFESVYADDPSGEKKSLIQTFLTEYEYIKYNSMGRVPSKLDIEDIQRVIIEGTTPSARSNLINYLFKREMSRRGQKMKKKLASSERSAKLNFKYKSMTEKSGGLRTGLLSKDGAIMYGLWHNSLLCRISDNKLKVGKSSSRLVQAALYGPKLIFDFDFDDYMTPWICRNVGEQIQEAYGLNRFNYREPFDLWFCNFRENSESSRQITEKCLKNLYSGSLVTVKDDCFTNYFDKSRLVYLTPNAQDPLTTVGKNDDVYIIGAYNDKGNMKPLTFRKASKLGIRARCLPIDTHLAWKGSSKSLCVNHVTGILLEVMANGGDWHSAFKKHIPSRKIKPIELVIEEEELRMTRLREKRKRHIFSITKDIDLF